MQLLPVSHQKQRQQSDCLAACAAMLLHYLEIPYEYERLIRLLDIQAYGTAFSKVRNLVDPFGLHVDVEEGDFDALRSCLALALPPLVPISTDSLSYWESAVDHAVVVVGMDDTRVALSDPAFDTAPQIISQVEFGVALVEQDYKYAVISLTGIA